MSADPGAAIPAWDWRREFFPGSRDSATAMKVKDGLAIALATLLPWSTTATSILAILFALALLPTPDVRTLRETLRMPASVTAIALFGVGVVGLVWASGVSWSDSLRSIGQLSKLLFIPLLLYHFRRSERGIWALMGFALSCCVLLAWSWLSWIFPDHVRIFSQSTAWQGVAIKNYITQSQEFTLCAFAFAGLAFRQLRAGRRLAAMLLLLLVIAFVADMLFVVSARTALVYLPVILALFAIRHFGLRANLVLIAVVLAAVAAAWMSSSFLRMRVNAVATEYQRYQDDSEITSTGERLEYWRKSAKFIADAPLLGHGTGSIRGLFQRDADGKTGTAAVIVANPHNQTLHTALQWGALGCLVLYAMWLSHLRMFLRDDLLSWIGLAAVVENFTSSLLNSHIADFTEGWLYVLAVGILGGMVRRNYGAAVEPRVEP